MTRTEEIRSIYFIGIGGIGMSGLARYFKQMGAEVAGYDRTETALTRQLVGEGISVTYNEQERPTDGVELAVFTPAVPASHPAFAHFRERGVPIVKRAELLGIISRSRRCIAVAGTHGKTTTSAILTHLLRVGGVDCTAFLGGIAANYGTNYLLGRSDWMVVEADEYDRSFLHLHPTILVLNALDPDHLDIYGDAKAMHDAYFQLVRQVRPGGTFLYRAGLPVDEDLLEEKEKEVFDFGEGAEDFRLVDVRQDGGVTVMDIRFGTREFLNVRFPLPGKHNATNAAAAFAVGLLLGIPDSLLREGLESFRGVDRRFSIHFDAAGTTYVDDYAHHPVEVEGLVQAARSRFPGRRITGVFQPHLFTRTRDFAEDFARVLDQFDEPIVTDIYPAREQPIEGIDAAYLLSLMKHPGKRYVPRAELLDFIRKNSFDVLVTVGAGDVDSLIPDIVHSLKTRTL